MADKSIMSYETVALDDEKSALVILDQTKLPYEVEILSLTDQKDIWNAIYLLQVRGAPAIGVAAGFGVYLAAKQIQADNWEDFYTQFKLPRTTSTPPVLPPSISPGRSTAWSRWCWTTGIRAFPSSRSCCTRRASPSRTRTYGCAVRSASMA